MSNLLTRFAELDSATGLLSLPLWISAAATALLVILCLLAFSQAGREGATGALARVALVMIGVGVAGVALESSSRREFAKRHPLDMRVHELLTRAAVPGSALACLDAMAGDAVETACEKALFRTPEATAAAVSYTSAQLTLIADLTERVRRSNASGEPTALGHLRRAVESDRFGLVARVLAIREGCTPDVCTTFALLDDTSRIRINLAERTYDVYVVRHSAAWSDTDKSPVATVARAAPAAPFTAGGAAGLIFPSSESIPPVNIMDPEPRASAEMSGVPAPSTTSRVPLPPRRPAQFGSPAQAGDKRASERSAQSER